LATKERSAKREEGRRCEMRHMGAMLKESESRAEMEEGEVEKLKARGAIHQFSRIILNSDS
jgi:hypothetical protein